MTNLKSKTPMAVGACVKSIVKSATNIVSAIDRGLTPDVVAFAMVSDLLMVVILVAGKVVL